MIELFDHRAVGAAGRESPDMSFKKHCLLPGQALPFRLPTVVMIDDLARSGDVVGLKMRGGIWNVEFAVDPKAVTRPGLGFCHMHFKPAAIFIHVVRRIEQQFDFVRRRRPQPEGDAFVRQYGAEHACRRHGRPAKTRIELGLTVHGDPVSPGMLCGSPCAVSSKLCHLVAPGHSGRVNSTSSATPFMTTNSGSPVSVGGPRM